MKVSLHTSFQDVPEAREAESILRTCVHCGICTATCPTYQELGDERDGPRGRIYLIKQLLEEGQATNKTTIHLDRCLTCLSCETSCPSLVQYGRLLDIGRGLLEQRTQRSLRERMLRWGLRRVLPFEHRFTPLLKLGQIIRPVLPKALKAKVPARQSFGSLPEKQHKRHMLIAVACAQPGAKPNTNAATARILNRLGVSLHESREAGCCGALSYHLGAHEEGLQFMRRNIDAWWPQIAAGAEAIVVTASGCGVTIKDYGSLLSDDPDYAEKARRVSELTRDLSEILIDEDLAQLNIKQDDLRTAVHCPCTLHHGQRLPTIIDDIMTKLGIRLVATEDRHMCCGSAGTYSILQPKMSQALLDNKLKALCADKPDRIVTANIGCHLHLGSKSKVPVQHWIEVLDSLVTG